MCTRWQHATYCERGRDACSSTTEIGVVGAIARMKAGGITCCHPTPEEVGDSFSLPSPQSASIDACGEGLSKDQCLTSDLRVRSRSRGFLTLDAGEFGRQRHPFAYVVYCKPKIHPQRWLPVASVGRIRPLTVPRATHRALLARLSGLSQRHSPTTTRGFRSALGTVLHETRAASEPAQRRRSDCRGLRSKSSRSSQAIRAERLMRWG